MTRLSVTKCTTVVNDMEEPSPIIVYSPLVTRERFSELSGLGEETIRGMVDKGHLPTVKVGKHRMINLALLNESCLKEVWEK